jgi:uncharacterized protein
MTASSQVASAPVAEAERIQTLDVLRGFAVLGILVMNIQSYGMPLAAYLNPHAAGPLEGADWWAWLAGHALADRKFINMFSMLFGAGVLLFAARIEARGDKPRALHYRRMLWLLLFGAAHAYLLWYGDILFSYAVCGMLIYPLRRRRPRTLLLVGLLVMAVGSAFYLFAGWSMKYWPPEEIVKLERENWRPPAEDLAREINIYRGGWLEQMQERVPTSFFLQTQYLLMYELWRAGGLMLIGMALFQWGALRGERSDGFYWRCIAAGALIGMPVTLYGLWRNVAAGWDLHYSFFIGPQFNYWSSVLTSLMYIGVLSLLVRKRAAQWLTSRLAAAGQMAFTNYIMQTVICTTIFYGHGLGLYSRVSRTAQLGIVLAIWMLQLAYSPWWLRRFRFGPLEWLWRSLTYGAFQPLSRTASS